MLGTSFRLVSFVLALALLAPAAGAAPRPSGEIPRGAAEQGVGDPLVERIQRGLAEAGLYLGPINGVMNDETEAAIRAFQKRSGFPIDPQVSEELARQLESGARIQRLLERLEETREKNIRKAREALMSREETRRLLDAPADEAADPTRDFSPCLQDPTPRCLLAEAAEAAKAVSKADMRDWARGELLVVQAKAGLIPQAMDTARRIRDPRLILVALRDIAEGQAQAGQADDALAAVDIIPDADKRAEALAAIARIQAEAGAAEATRRTVERLLVAVGDLTDPVARVSFEARAAVALGLAGDAARARGTLETAEAHARAVAAADQRGAALRHVAAAQAGIGRPDAALALVEAIVNEADRTPVLVETARVHARQGGFAAALDVAERIREARYKTVAFSRVAARQAGAGQLEAARETVARAEVLARDVELPYARDYAASHIALALTGLGEVTWRRDADPEPFDRAVEKAAAISDERLRAHTLWTIAADRRGAGDAAGAERTAARAEQATDAIRSSLSRVWMMAEIAVERADRGRADSAGRMFRRALGRADAIDNAWGRARAVAKVADALLALQRAGVAVPPPSAAAPDGADKDA